MSKVSVANKAFDDNNEEATWETCTLRKWLNNDFLEKAFSNEEKELIATTTVLPDAIEGGYLPYNLGNSCVDKIFLLSDDEIESIQDIDTYNDESNECFWLRTLGAGNNGVTYYGERAGCEKNFSNGVRPAMWIILN